MRFNKSILQNHSGIKNLIVVALFSCLSFYSVSQNSEDSQINSDELNHFIELIYTKDSLQQSEHLSYIENNWKDEYAIMVMELAFFNYDKELGGQLMDILNDKSEQNLGYSLNDWYQYLWSKDEAVLPNYHLFKAEIYKNIDPLFETYFKYRSETSFIRFDEIRWGGVVQDGIPPLHDPEMISAAEADYLEDHHIVFGVEVNGDVRAYPKRILAWHEMFTATVGGEHLTGVYCTLCGTVILYKSTVDGVQYEFGTSGFLFRSNKLMYDKQTQSLWSTVWGIPVVGPLVNQDIQLEYLSVVTTTWGEWKKLHPDSKVLSLNTGYQRDYGEGVAYNDYFSNDQIMFVVPQVEAQKIRNKQSVLALRLQDDLTVAPVAISVQYLKKHSLFHYQIGEKKLLILTDKTAANRVYEVGDKNFKRYDPKKSSVLDQSGVNWRVTEYGLINHQGDLLPRFHTYNAFWFGWQAAYPNTVLIK